MTSVRIRLESDDQAALDAHEQALRTVLTVPGEPGRDYPNRRSAAARRYLESTGVRTPGAGGPAPLDVATAAKQRRDLPGEIGALTAADADLKRRWWFPLRPGDVVLSYLPPVADSPAYGQTYVAVDEGTDAAGCARLREVSTTDGPDDESDDKPDEDLPEFALTYDVKLNLHTLWRRNDDGTELVEWRVATGQPSGTAWATEVILYLDCWGYTPPVQRRITLWRDRPTPNGSAMVPVFEGDRWDPDKPAAEVNVGPRLTDFYSLWFEAGPDAITVIRAGAIVHGYAARAEVTR